MRLQRRAVKLLPGEYYVTTEDIVIVTVLGSCVAACIRDVRTGHGGMNHFMLPTPSQHEEPDTSYAARYGTQAMELLINGLIRGGTRREHLEAKIFGGAGLLMESGAQSVGRRNAEFAVRFLEQEGIRIAATGLLGDMPRKVYFFPSIGEVRVRYLKRLKNDTIPRREAAYAMKIQHHPISGQTELFS